MARAIITMPASINKRLSAIDWDIDWRTQPSPEGTDGNSRVMVGGFPRWVGSLNLTLFRDDILTWRATRAQAKGRLGLYRVIMVDPIVPVPIEGQPWGNGQPWANGLPWVGESFWVVETAAARGATSVRVTIPTDAPVPKVGQIVSHDDWPTRVVAASLASGVWTLTIDRPLMAAAQINDTIDLRAKGVFEASDDAAGNPSYESGRTRRHTSYATIQLREYLSR